MATLENVVALDMKDDDLLNAIQKARTTNFLDNLRNRNPFIKLDSSIRGYLGEICFSAWLSSHGVLIKDTNLIHSEENMDVDLTLKNDHNDNIKLELKTSLVPDKWKSLQDVFAQADIKIIKREQDYRAVTADFHVQIYFNQYRMKRDTFLKNISGNISAFSDEQLIEKMKLRTLKQVVVAWIDKTCLISFLEKEKLKTWNFAMREFWRCPLSMAKEANDLPEAIKTYLQGIN